MKPKIWRFVKLREDDLEKAQKIFVEICLSLNELYQESLWKTHHAIAASDTNTVKEESPQVMADLSTAGT
ncbi:hypothetical protein [Desulforhopalus sp. IMCC35007]|uniref:hypothetical protein n=1 Tax=Desulforhopalus sp. IMCC35007 TaxID=2569543 RepID=UPI0010ADC989|nr:hypothetical protein [Desulforhopalus sp. IMCC35007]TKB12386.1 hypothetical protein FCL48_01680 [Desulforhopalus sp. IMCC35007]